MRRRLNPFGGIACNQLGELNAFSVCTSCSLQAGPWASGRQLSLAVPPECERIGCLKVYFLNYLCVINCSGDENRKIAIMLPWLWAVARGRGTAWVWPHQQMLSHASCTLFPTGGSRAEHTRPHPRRVPLTSSSFFPLELLSQCGRQEHSQKQLSCDLRSSQKSWVTLGKGRNFPKPFS